MIIFACLVAPFAFTACTDDAVDDVQPQVVDTGEVGLTDDEEVRDK